MNHFHWLIIGAGPCGLSTARRLLQAGETDLLILERNQWPGGLSASFRDRHGFTWDQGGHVIFSHYPEYERLLNELIPPESWYQHRREAWVRFPQGRVPYPLQLHLGWLPEEKRKECVKGLRTAWAAAKETNNFHDWIRTRFGDGIAKLFMEPYNRKLWNCPTRDLGVYWLEDRVAIPLEKDLLQNRRSLPWGANAFFRFPPQGGTGAIWNALAGRIGSDYLCYGTEVSRIEPSGHRLITKEGTSFSYDYLLSSMPLTSLIRSCDLSAPEAKSMDNHLRAVPVVVVGLGLSGPLPQQFSDVTWMYFPDPRTRIYRLTVFSRYSPDNVPARSGYWSLLLELSSLPEEIILKNLVEETVSDLRDYGLLDDESKVVSRWARYLSHAYPIPTLNRDEVRLNLLEKLAADDIYSRGRLGAWMYEAGNMDHSAMQGIEWAEHLLQGREEITIAHPQRINQSVATPAST